METLICKVPMPEGVGREEGTVGERASPEVSVDGGGAARPGLCNSTHLRTCLTYL